jgi:polyhydroxyalkanoate synthase
LGLGLLGLVYAASRRAGSGEPARSPGEVRETVGDAVPGAESEPAIEEPAEGGMAEDTLPGEDRSTAEIAERAEENVEEEPAPPGEMAVDEDVVEEIVDEGAEDVPADEAESSQEDEAESDADEGRT